MTRQAWIPALLLSFAACRQQPQSSLHAAAALLLRRGAAPDAPSREGATALALAAYQANLRLVETLLAHGADPSHAGVLGSAAAVCLFVCRSRSPERAQYFKAGKKERLPSPSGTLRGLATTASP